ncbi:MAG: FG-GAP repeat domain-containing protein [Planctomycetota bacterium]
MLDPTPTSRIYRNDSGTFTNINAGLTGVSASPLAWGDYDNDGDLDLALAGYTGSVEICEIYRNDGGTFTNIHAPLTSTWLHLGILIMASLATSTKTTMEPSLALTQD